MLKNLCFTFLFLLARAAVAQESECFPQEQPIEADASQTIECRESEQYDRIFNMIKISSKMSDDDIKSVTQEIIIGWRETGISPSIILAVIEQESKFNPCATNRSSVGLMQVIPRYGKPFVDKKDMRGSLVKTLKIPCVNVKTGIRMMKNMQNATKSWNDKSYNLMLSAYNKGPSKATRKPIKYSSEVKKKAVKYRAAGIA